MRNFVMCCVAPPYNCSDSIFRFFLLPVYLFAISQLAAGGPDCAQH
jgi:hypothetical protein